MPRHQKEPHLVKRAARYNKAGKLTHASVWVIYDGTKRKSTGCGSDDLEGAKVALHKYNVESHATTPLPEGKLPHEVVIGDLIRFYLQRRKDKVQEKTASRKKDYLRDMQALVDFWSERVVSDINEENCIAYRKGKALNTARRQLQDLRAIVNFAELKGKLDKGGRILDYALPPKPKARIHFYSRDEVAKLVWTAYRRKNEAIGDANGHKTSLHTARFILTAVYTGTRAERIQEASFEKEEGRPWIDLERGIFFRKFEGEMVPTNKRADPVRIPKPLLEHMRRWQKGKPGIKGKKGKPGSAYLVEYQGRPVDTRKGFYSLKMEVFDEARAKAVNRHTLRHTCATWLMQAGVSISLVAKYISATEKVVEEVYGHHHPDFQAEADHAFSRGKAGRGKEGRKKAA